MRTWHGGVVFALKRSKMRRAKKREGDRTAIRVREFFRGEPMGDFGAPLCASDSIIFLLTSFCVDSIHSISCNNASLQDSMKNGKGRIESMATKKKAKKKTSKKH